MGEWACTIGVAIEILRTPIGLLSTLLITECLPGIPLLVCLPPTCTTGITTARLPCELARYRKDKGQGELRSYSATRFYSRRIRTCDSLLGNSEKGHRIMKSGQKRNGGDSVSCIDRTTWAQQRTDFVGHPTSSLSDFGGRSVPDLSDTHLKFELRK